MTATTSGAATDFGQSVLTAAAERIDAHLRDPRYEPTTKAYVRRPGMRLHQRVLHAQVATKVTVGAGVASAACAAIPILWGGPSVFLFWFVVFGASAQFAFRVIAPGKNPRSFVFLGHRSRVLAEAAGPAVRAARRSRTPAAVLLRQPLRDAHAELLVHLARIEDAQPVVDLQEPSGPLDLPEFIICATKHGKAPVVPSDSTALDAAHRLAVACLAALWVIESRAHVGALETPAAGSAASRVEAIVRAAHPNR